MARLYNISLDSLIEFDVELDEIQEMIEKTNETVEAKIDWTSAWERISDFNSVSAGSEYSQLCISDK